MSRNQREGYFAGKYGSASVVRRSGFKGRRVGSAHPYRTRDREFSLRGAQPQPETKGSNQ